MKRFMRCALLAALLLLALGGCALAHTTLASGSCGDSATTTWEYWEDENGLITLEIGGTGPILEDAWSNEYHTVSRLILGEGITSIPE